MLTDYEALADIFCNIKSSRVISRQPGIVLHQVCQPFYSLFGLFWPIRGPVHQLALRITGISCTVILKLPMLSISLRWPLADLRCLRAFSASTAGLHLGVSDFQRQVWRPAERA